MLHNDKQRGDDEDSVAIWRKKRENLFPGFLFFYISTVFKVIVSYPVIRSSHFNIPIIVNIEIQHATTNTVQVNETGILL